MKVKKIIRRKKVKVTKKLSGKPGWDHDNKVAGTEGDDYNWRSNRQNAKHVDLSGSNQSPTIPAKGSKFN